MNTKEVQRPYKGIEGLERREQKPKLSSWMDLSYGMFVHLGLYSELGGVWQNTAVLKGYSEQIQMWTNISHEAYSKVAESFTLSKFDPSEIVALAKASGMTYLVITSKHHDGFCLFDTATTEFNTVKATPFGQDVVKLLADECRKQGIQFGIYYSLVDWHLGHDFDTNNGNTIPPEMEAIIEKQLTELMTQYGDVAEVWFDMGSPTPQQSLTFSRIVQTHQPNAAINGRIWNNKGDFRTLDDNQIPANKLEGAWQTPASIYNETWGYREWQVREKLEEKAANCLRNLISVRARGGNYLLNIGPKGDGSLVPFERAVLEKMGEWITKHKAAVIQSQPTLFKKPDWGEITVNRGNLYLHIFDRPENNRVTLSGLASAVKKVVIDTEEQELEWSLEGNQLDIWLPEENQELVTTLKVSIEAPFTLIPDRAVEETDGKWILTGNSLDKGFNFTDSGSYTTLKETVVKITGYIKQSVPEPVTVSIEGEANNQYVYEVRVGNETKRISGKELTRGKTGPFFLSLTECVVPISIKLANPIDRYQDIDLKLDKIIVEEVIE